VEVDNADLDQLLEAVKDRDSFLVFVSRLAADRRAESMLEAEKPSNPYGPGALGWESWTIEDFLEAAHAWATDHGPREGGLPESPSWRAFARFLYAGKFYE